MESKKYMSMRNDVVEMGFRNMDPFTADLFCLVLRQVKKNIEDDKVIMTIDATVSEDIDKASIVTIYIRDIVDMMKGLYK